ncbi:MAG: hypothetical protein JOZ86_12485 [Candidatus Eremiobacteraeota bacterium]|nr:hypothetical protein [Candidatus Eremiobacteraeota bacterium]
MAAPWREPLRDLGAASALLRASWRAFLVPLLAATLVLALDQAMQGTHASVFVTPAALAALAYAQACSFRAFAAELDAPIGAPMRGFWYLLWGAFCTALPVLIAAIPSFAVWFAVSKSFPEAWERAIALQVIFAPMSLLVVLQGWAYSYVAVDGADAPAATGGLLQALRQPRNLKHLVFLGALMSIVGTLIAAPFQWFVLPHHSTPLTRFLAAIIETVPDAFWWALLFVTRPVVSRLSAVVPVPAPSLALDAEGV